MKYFLDTEFLEGTQKTLFGKTKPTIDLISIGIVCEDGREYYAISKEFNLKEAWNRFDLKVNKQYPMGPEYNKEYWILENVLKPIWIEKCNKGFTLSNSPMTPKGIEKLFTYKNFKKLINKYGKTNKQIAEEVKEFVYNRGFLFADNHEQVPLRNIGTKYTKSKIEFYSYYADYDWVVFCWLFGKMIDLPKGFPIYCIDLKQTLDEKWNRSFSPKEQPLYRNIGGIILQEVKDHPKYPKQTNEHNALADARWNYELYKFLQNL